MPDPRLTRLRVPEQIVELHWHPDRWMGDIEIDGESYRIEAYSLMSPLGDDLHHFAECGAPLKTHVLPNGETVFLAVMPKGR